MEIFKKIEGFNGYSISNLGTVRNDKTGKFLKFFKKREGYLQVQLGKKNNPLYVHRLVANAFIPNIFDLPTINFNQGVGLQVLSYLLLNREINFPTATFIEEDDTDGEV